MTEDRSVTIRASKTVPYGKVTNLTLICERGPFRPRQIVGSPESADDFVVMDVKVDKNSQDVMGIPACFFVDADQVLDLSALGRGQYMTISVVNVRRPQVLSRSGELVDGVDYRAEKNEKLVETVERPFSVEVVGDLLGSVYGETAQPEGLRVLGIGQVEVQPHTVPTIRLRCERPFRPDRLTVVSSPGLSVVEVRVKGQVVASTGAETRDGRFDFDGPDLLAGDWLAIKVACDSDVPLMFRGAFSGRRR